MKEKIEKITWKHAYIVLAVGYSFLMFPLLWISKYNHMCADDFGYGLHPHRAWMETGNLIEVIKEAVEVAVNYYDWWQGTYSSIVLMAVQPGIFGEKYYFLGALFLYAVFHLALIYLAKTIFCRLLGGEKYAGGILTILLLVLTIQFMDSPVQSFYFYNAGVHYIFMVSVMWIMTAMQIRTFLEKQKGRLWFYCIAQILLGIILGGGNYITAFSFLLTGISLFALAIAAKNKKWLWCLPGFLAEAVGFVVSAAAPGNTVRVEVSDGVSPIRAILLSFEYALEYLNDNVNMVVVLILALMVPLMWTLTEKTTFNFRLPVIVIGYLYCLYAAMFTPTCYALGYPGAGRCRNVYVIFLYLYLVLAELYLVGWMRRKITLNAKDWAVQARIGIGTAGMAVILLVVTDEPNDYMSLSAVQSIYHKEAQLYHVIQLEREQQLNGEGEYAVIRSCPIQPKLLFFADISTDPEDWKNVATAKWYNKKAVAVEKTQ
nr:hypothetical protein [Lachnospiraceae bacterium]